MKKLIFSLLLGAFSFSYLPAEEPAFPVVILGGGVGALTSAVYLGRSGISPLVIEGASPGGAIAQSPRVQNWPGELEIAGLDLVEKIHKQAEHNGAHFLNEEVIAVNFQKLPFIITTRDIFDHDKTRTIFANSCIIAMGSTPNFLGVPGEEAYWTNGVYTCAVCDGGLYKDKVVAVVGGGDAAILEAEHLTHIAKKVFLVVRKDTFRAKEEKRVQELLSRPNVEVLFQTTVEEVIGNGKKVTQLLINRQNNKLLLNVDALFLAIGAKPNTQLFQGQLDLDENGYILLRKDQETSVKGVFAIGDAVDPLYKQAIIASGHGAIAACQAAQFVGPAVSPILAKTPTTTPATQVAQNPHKKSWLPIYPKKEKEVPKKEREKELIEILGYEQFKKEVRNANTPIFVDFYATWCGPCKSLSPMYEGWAKEYAGKAKFFKVDVDKNFELASQYRVSSMPTVLLLDKNGKEIARKVGTNEISSYMRKFDPAAVK